MWQETQEIEYNSVLAINARNKVYFKSICFGGLVLIPLFNNFYYFLCFRSREGSPVRGSKLKHQSSKEDSPLLFHKLRHQSSKEDLPGSPGGKLKHQSSKEGSPLSPKKLKHQGSKEDSSSPLLLSKLKHQDSNRSHDSGGGSRDGGDSPSLQHVFLRTDSAASSDNGEYSALSRGGSRISHIMKGGADPQIYLLTFCDFSKSSVEFMNFHY